jgi:hypothetical protein
LRHAPGKTRDTHALPDVAVYRMRFVHVSIAFLETSTGLAIPRHNSRIKWRQEGTTVAKVVAVDAPANNRKGLSARRSGQTHGHGGKGIFNGKPLRAFEIRNTSD